MRVQRPGLFVLGIILIAGLVYLWGPLGSTPADPSAADKDATRVGKTRTGDGKTGQDLVADAATTADSEKGEAREAITSGPRYVLRGVVQRRDEYPLEGATVLAYRGKPSDRTLNMTSLMSAVDPDSAVAAERLRGQLGDVLESVSVQADGSFEFRMLPTQHVRLTLEHDFYGLAQAAPVHLDADGDDFAVLRPYLGGHLVGRIQGYVPAEDLTVKLISEIDPMFFMRNPQDFVGQAINSVGRYAPVTGADGRFEFRAILPSSSLSLLYRGPVQTASREELRVEPGQRVEVVLLAKGAATIDVKVTHGGAPLEHARVTAVHKHSRGQVAVHGRQRASTDATGVAHLDRLRPGPYEVDIDCEGYVAVNRETFANPDKTVTVTVELGRGGAVRGRVVDPQGNPVADAGVRFVPSLKVPILGDLNEMTGQDLLARSAKGARQRTDARGEFVVHGLLDNGKEFGLVAWHEDFAGGFVKNVNVGDEDVVIELERPTRIVGKVLDGATDEPIEDFTIESLVKMMMFMERPSRSLAVTGSKDGAFDMRRVPPGKATLRIRALGYADLRESITVTDGGEIDLGELRLKRGATVRGVVKTTDGNPAAGVTVGPKAVGMLDNPMLQSMFGAATTSTDQSGSFELAGLRAGGLILKASSYEHASGVSKRLKLKPGEVVENIEITLAVGGTLEGSLELAEDMQGTGWMVTVSSPQGGSMRTGMVSDDGTFRFSGIDPGRYEVQAMQLSWMRDMQSEKMGLLRPGRNFDIGKMIESAQREILRTRCRIKDGETTQVVLDGTELGTDGTELRVQVTLGPRPMDTGWLEVERLADGLLTQGMVRDGRCKLPSLQPGPYRLTVRTGITRTPVGDPHTVTVPKDVKSYSTKIALSGGSIAGIVIDEGTTKPLRHAVVRVVAKSDEQANKFEELGFAVTNGDGEFRFDGLSDGEYSVFANDSFFNMGAKKHGGRLDGIRIRGGAAVAKLVLRAKRAARAKIRVSDPSDLAVGRTMLLAVDPDGKPLSTLPTFTDAKGEATMNGLPPGRLRIVALGGNLVPGYSSIEEIEEAGAVDIVVTMGKGPRVRVLVQTANGKPILGARLSARWHGGPWLPLSLVQRRDRKSGLIDLGHLPPIAVEFRVHPPAGKPFVVQRTLPSGSSAELVFTAPK